MSKKNIEIDPKIKELIDKQQKLRKELSKIDNAIEALRDICDHAWKDIGHDSHKDHYECSKCGATDSW